MPEIKHQFTGGKMNKDVDERLVPKGEYRHAMNIQVSTSESSNVGTIQNILGNKLLIGQNAIPNGSTCIGSIADEKNDTLYWFTTENSFRSAFDGDNAFIEVGPGANQQGQGNPWTTGSGAFPPPLDTINGTSTNFFSSDFYTKKRRNTIYRVKEELTTNSSGVNNINSIVEPVFVDDAGLLVTVWSSDTTLASINVSQGQAQLIGTTSSQTDIANDLFSSGTWLANAGSQVVLGAAMNSSNTFGDHGSYGFLNNGFGIGTNAGPVAGVNTGYQLNIYDAADIKVGDKVKAIGINPWTNNYEDFFPENIRVTSKFLMSTWVDANGDTKEHHVITLNEKIGSFWWNQIEEQTITDTDNNPWSPSAFSGLLLRVLVSHFEFDHSVLQFSAENLITGINIIDDMLFWTDNKTEPKKINIPRSIEGTDSSGLIHTRLINSARDITYDTGIDIRVEHITVIKKSPKSPPVLGLNTSRNPSLNYSAIIYTQEPGSPSIASFLSSSQTTSGAVAPDPNVKNFQGAQPGDVYYIKLEETIDGLDPSNDPAGYPINFDILQKSNVVLKECHVSDGITVPNIPIMDDWRIKAKIIDWQWNTFLISDLPGQSFNSSINLKIQVQAVNGSPPVANPSINAGQLNYVIDAFDETEKLFEYKFPRFAYRYQYEDGEYSTFSPFSQVAFITGGFNFEPRKGYNLGMTNLVSSIDIKNFITNDMPQDVVKIDILYKDETSPNIYLVESITPKDATTDKWDNNMTTITDENIKSTLPSNQLLRPYDNVPRKALAQEVTGSRIVYANYLQNLDLSTSKNRIFYSPEFNHSLVEFIESDVLDSEKISIKSLREYQLGVTFLDEFGRETPILTSTDGSFKVSKKLADKNNRLQVALGGSSYPINMKYYKFYIKETSNEYYNMAMDRYYDAEDGNVWLAFPSSDRNKIDIDTFLILKKGVDSSSLVQEKARYKVLAIENEAPDYIKTSRILVAEEQNRYFNDDGTTATNPIFTPSTMNNVPKYQGSSFKVDYAPFGGGSGGFLDKLKEKEQCELYVEFIYQPSASATAIRSSKYKIAELTAEGRDFILTGDTLDPTFYNIKIDGIFDTDINFICDNPSDPFNANGIRDLVTIRFWKYKVENKPQFDGRFFVKIFADPIFENVIKNVFDENQEFVPTEAKDVYFMHNNNDYMTGPMSHMLSYEGGESHSGTSVSGWGDTTRLVRYMSYFQDMKMFSGMFAGNPMSNMNNVTRCKSTTAGATLSQGNATYKWNVPGRWYIDRSSFQHTCSNNRIEGALNAGEWDFIPNQVDEDGILNYVFAGENRTSVSLSLGGLVGIPTFPGDDQGIYRSEFASIGNDWLSGNTTPNAIPEANGYVPKLIDNPTGSIEWRHRTYADSDQLFGPGSGQGFTGSRNNHWFGIDLFNVRSSLGIFNQQSPSNNHHADQFAFADKIESGLLFQWKEDPNGTVYEIVGGVDEKQKSRNPAEGMDNTESVTGGGWGGTGNERPNEIRPANFSKTFKFDVFPDMSSWNPTELSELPTHGPIPNGVIIGVDSNPITGSPGVQFTVEGSWSSSSTTPATQNFTQTQVGTNMSCNVQPYIRINDITGWASNLAEPSVQQLLERKYILTNINGSGSHTNLLVDEIEWDNIEENYKIYITGYHKRLEQTDFPANLTVGHTVEFKQASMNGLSPEAANSLNMDPSISNTYQIIGSVGYTLQFVSPVISDLALPENPAVWETEPKEDVDLDIYYEISDTLPLFLDNTTIGSFIPIGSVVSSQSGALGSFTTVTNTYDNVIELSDVVETSPGGLSSLSPNTITSNDFVTITRPDGSVVDLDIRGFLFINSNYPFASHIVLEQYIHQAKNLLNWHNCYSWGNGVESNRIRDNFNLPFISNGVRVSSTIEKTYKEEQRKYGLIYSGIYNSNSGVNDLNQFIAAEKITKDINPTYGSIQKLYSRSTADGDLITLCEDRVLKILANKDALFNADGNTNLTATKNVLGQTMPYSGEYGISKNPESFAAEAYRAYFTDRVRGAVIRLSKDGLTPISDHGMKDWFRDNLKYTKNIFGSYDDYKDEYNITLKQPYLSSEDSNTLTFREDAKGWVSFKSFIKEHGDSAGNNYYTFKQGKAYKHHVNDLYNTFYGVHKDSIFKVILNDVPGSIKSFTTFNYEGSQSRIIKFDDPITGSILDDGEYYNLQPKDGWYINSIETEQDKGSINEFIEKEKKWFNYIKGVDLSVTDSIANDFDGANFSHQGLGTLTQNPINITVYGCMDPLAFNYDPAAQIDDPNNPCIPIISGCMDPNATNYYSLANVDSGGCVFPGCTDGTTVNGCGLGCNGALNYDPQANIDDGSCTYCVLGCIDSTAFNFNSQATCDDGTCVPFIPGCMDTVNANVTNYDPLANIDDGSCEYYGCTNPVTQDALGNPYNAATNFLWDYSLYGASFINASGNSMACLDYAGNNSVYSQVINSPTHSAALNTINQNSNLSTPLTVIPPCATVDDGSCILEGCTDSTAINYDPLATIAQTATCVFCADPNAFNYTLNSQTQYPNAPTTACEYCPQVQNISTDNVTYNSFDIIWENPSPISPPPGSTSTGNNGVYKVIINWGVSSQVPPYAVGGQANAGGGYFQYIPEFLANGTQSYPAITDLGGGMLSITVNLGQFTNGVILGAPGIIANTQYSVAIDTFCTNDTGGFDPNGNALQNIETEFIASNGPGQVQVTTAVSPIIGCTDPTAVNYDPLATVDSGNCISPTYGCTDDGTDPNFPGRPSGFVGPATNYLNDPFAVEDGTCVYIIPGCTDVNACNYDPLANFDDGSCVAIQFGCFDQLAMNASSTTNLNPCVQDNPSMCVYTGCMDPTACNYALQNNPTAAAAAITNAQLDCSGNVANISAGNFGDTSCCEYCGDDSALNFSGTISNCTSGCEYCGGGAIELFDANGVINNVLKIRFGPNNTVQPDLNSFNASTDAVSTTFFLDLPSSYSLSNVAQTPFVNNQSNVVTIYEIWYKIVDQNTGVMSQLYAGLLTSTTNGQATNFIPNSNIQAGLSYIFANTIYEVFIGVGCYTMAGPQSQPFILYSPLPIEINTTLVLTPPDL